MNEIGLFPLPIVVLAGERVPLHIFEERYKELVGESIARSAEFGVLLVDDEGVRSVGTLAAVVEVVARHPDGRMDVVVEGRARFRVVSTTEGRSFLTAEVEPYPDDDDPPAEEEIAECRAAFAELAEAVGGESVEVDERGGLAFGIAAHVEFPPDVKQELLESRSERDRVVRLTALLAAASEQVRYRALAAERAAGNGKVET